MSHWNYRLCTFRDGSRTWFAIHEVYYDEDGKPNGWTENPILGPWDEELEAELDLAKMSHDLKRLPVLHLPTDPRPSEQSREGHDPHCIGGEKGPCNCGVDQSPQPDGGSIETSALCARITEYLSSGGLFNPELMTHAKVRDLLIDCRDALGPQVQSDVTSQAQPRSEPIPFHEWKAGAKAKNDADGTPQLSEWYHTNYGHYCQRIRAVPPKSGQPNISAVSEDALRWLKCEAKAGHRESLRAAKEEGPMTSALLEAHACYADEIAAFIEGAGQ